MGTSRFRTPFLTINSLAHSMHTAFPPNSPMDPAQKLKTKGKGSSANVLNNKAEHFQAIIQLIQIVVNLIPRDEPEHHGDKLTSVTRSSFDFVDTITNLMVRNDEVVAAVACGPSRGIISTNSTSKTFPHENAQVRPQYTHIFSIPLIHPQPASMDNLNCTDSESDSELDGMYPPVRVATVANSKNFNPKDFEMVPGTSPFMLLSSSNPKNSWTELKKCKPELVNAWCD